MLAFNPGEPRFQNGTRPSQGSKKDFLWGRCFLQFSEQHFCWEFDVSGGVREGAWAIRDQLLSEQSCISSWGKGALHRLSFALAVAGVFRRQAGLRWCECSFISPQEPSAPQCLFQTPHTSKIRKAQRWDTSQCWEGELGPRLPLPLAATWSSTLHRWGQLVQVTDHLAQHKEHTNKQTYPKPHLAVLHARDSHKTHV